MSICQVDVATNPETCGKPAVTRFAYGCIHEHVTKSLACADHADQLRTKTAYCGNCRQHDGHDCRLALREIALPKEAGR